MMRSARHAGRGLLMGMADLVPGISGGTVALLLGIHPRLVGAIAAFDRHVVRDVWRAARGSRVGRFALRRLDLAFLVPLVIGIATAVVLGARFVGFALHAWPGIMMALFFGVILSSTAIPWSRRAAPVPEHILWWGVGAVTAMTLGLAPAAHLPIVWWALIAAGALALTAMILPGISGSAFLVLLGAYGPVIDAVAQLDVRILGPFALGAVVGLAASSRILRWLFRTRGDATLAVLTGLLAGALVKVWPWRTEPAFGAGVPALEGPGWLLLVALAAAVAPWLFRGWANPGRRLQGPVER